MPFFFSLDRQPMYYMCSARLIFAVLLLLQVTGTVFGQGGPFRIQTDTLPAGTVGTLYSETFRATGNSTPPYTWSLDSGSLPPGLTLLPTGTLTGTPTMAGTFDFRVRVVDSNVTNNLAAPQSSQKAFSLTIIDALTITTGSPLPPGTVGTSYSQTFRAAGGTSPYTWSVASGSLPGGLTLSVSGSLSGTPSATGSFNFTIRVADSSASPRSSQKAFSLTIVAPLSITTSSPLASGIVGVSYDQTLTANGGTSPYTWSIASGSLPAGLSFSSSGTLNGTPTAAGSFNFTIRVIDSSIAQQTVQKAFTLTVVSLSITTTSPLPSGVVGTGYSKGLQASGGTPPYRWSIPSGGLPKGLSLASDGVLSGVPTTAGSFSFSIQVTDSRSPQQSAEQTFTLTIDNPNAASVTLTGLPGELNPTQQVPIALALSAPVSVPLSGTLTLSFTANGVAGLSDPLVMFSNGSRTASFNVPANSTAAVFPVPTLLLMTGTVAGSINLSASLQGNQPQSIGTVNIRSLPPQLRNVLATRTAQGLRVEITGYSPERRVQRADFEFRLRTASGIESLTLSRSVERDFENWYRSSTSAAFGSSFLFMQSFVLQGDTTAIEAVTITLANAQGSTSSSAIPLSN